jgi:NAD(P)-dependent dehydrogenase (short-subunit alcohol dehydrogenase family)
MGVLNEKVAIVTGAGKGIGEATAYALAKEGARVTVVARTLEDVEATATQVEKLGSEALALRCDVGNRDDVTAAVDACLERFGRLDILVNNAQTTFWAHTVEEWTDEEMRVTWQSGPLGTWHFMVAALPHLKERGGRVVNFVAPAGHGIIDGFAGYGMAKEAIRFLTKCAAREWGKYNINVNAISPIAFSAASAINVPTQADRDALFDTLRSPIRRFGDPEADVGRSIVFLCGPDSGMITGCTLGVDGGCAML